MEAELDRPEADRIIEKVTHSDWERIIIVLPRKDGRFHFCGEHRVKVNPVLDTDQYPLPNPFANLAGGQTLSKLDLSQAYQQLLLYEDPKKSTTIYQDKGLYQ